MSKSAKSKISKSPKMSNMPVVIFCGGMGSRIREETIDKPKPMINVGGKPILWHIMKMYKHHGFNDFILTLGYKGDYIRDFLKSSHGEIFEPFKITLAETGVDTPTGGRLLRSADFIKTDTFLCTYGDGFSDVDLNKVLDFHNNRDLVATLTSVCVPHKFGIISFSKEGHLKSYRKGHLMKDPINAGFFVFTKKYFDYLTDDMMIENPFNAVAKDKKFGVYFHDGYFGAVDTYKDLEDLNDLWNNKNPPWKVWND